MSATEDLVRRLRELLQRAAKIIYERGEMGRRLYDAPREEWFWNLDALEDECAEYFGDA